MLTRAGWPRPIVDGWPVPWVSPAESLAVMDKAREAACASGAICAVCGQDYAEGEQAVAFVKAEQPPENMAETLVQPMDNGILHARCAALALSRCPELASLHNRGVLSIVATTGGAAEAVDVDGSIKGRIDGKGCKVISKADLLSLAKP